MEYKLKNSEFYRVAYLVAGILMFLFLFGIFNLSSYASSGSFHGWYAQENVQNESYISFLQNFNPEDFNSFSNPCFDHSWSFTITKTPISGSNATNLTVNFLVHVVTSEGDMVIGTFLFPAGSGQSYSDTFSGSGTCFGVPTYAYLEVIASTEWARIAGNYSIDSWSLSIVPRDFGFDIDSNFSDYSSYSPLNLLADLYTTSDYGSLIFPSGSPSSFRFTDLNTSSITFSPYYNMLPLSKGTNYFSFVFSLTINSLAEPISTFYFDANGPLSSNSYSISDFTRTLYRFTPTGVSYIYSIDLVIENSDDFGILFFNFGGTTSAPISEFSFNALQYKMTVSDYMDYAKDQWSNLSPNVSQTNSNIADSVSTVGSASTYESAQFTSFDNLVSQTGVDTFSLSTVSTPLLWVGGLITTCYNNLPASIQYLLMFVGVFGLIVIILNSGSRVIRRFGGDS